MLEEEERFQQSVQKTYTLLQFTNILLLIFATSLTFALVFSITTQESLTMSLALLLGMVLFVGLLGYSTYYMHDSLADVCFHLALVAVFLSLQVMVLLGILISPTSITRIFTLSAKQVIDSHRFLVGLVLLVILLTTVPTDRKKI